MAQRDAVSILKEDHKTIQDLLDKLASTTDRGVKTRRKLLATLESELKAHTTVEEEVFYPAVKNAGTKKSDQQLIAEAKEEHHVADKVLRDLSKADPASTAFGGKAKVLKELIEHHVEEEEKEMFPRVRELFDKARLREIGEQMQARRQEIENGRAWDRSRVEQPAP